MMLTKGIIGDQPKEGVYYFGLNLKKCLQMLTIRWKISNFYKKVAWEFAPVIHILYIFLITLGILEHYINCRIHIDCMTLVYIYIACFANEFLITLGIFRTLYK